VNILAAETVEARLSALTTYRRVMEHRLNKGVVDPRDSHTAEALVSADSYYIDSDIFKSIASSAESLPLDFTLSSALLPS